MFFLFYFNRLIGTVLSYAIRAYTWHKFRVYIDITSLQLSPLGGRLFFKSIKYHGHNQTVFVHDGNITWRYWLRQVQDAQAYQHNKDAQHRAETPLDSSDESDGKARPRNRSVGKEEAGNMNRQQNLPCRILVKVSGVEAFLYNQSPVYDNILANLAKGGKADVSDINATSDQTQQDGDSDTKESEQDIGTDPQKTRSSVSESLLAQTVTGTSGDDTLPAFLRLFPIQIECKKAAAAVGNQHTPSIVTAKLENASGRIDADRATSLDLYKLLFSFDFNNVLVSLKPNDDFTTLQLQPAARSENPEDSKNLKKRRILPRLHVLRRLRKIFHLLKVLFTFKQKSNRSVRTASLLSNDEKIEQDDQPLPDESHWQGLARYLDESGHNEHHEWDSVEYARFSQLVDCEKVHMLFYWDVPGMVARQSHVLRPTECEVNGATPPEYGINLSVDGGVINYGPWADRQRIVLQNVFFPASYHDAEPTEVLAMDQTRLATVFKLHLCLDSDVVLRVPSREASKDWEWQGLTATHRSSNQPDAGIRKRKGKHSKKSHKNKKQQKPVVGGPDVRPFGWIDLKVLANSTVNYTMDMYARKDGYHNKLDLDIKGTEISSSVNHALLWRAGALALEADLSNPLRWNALRKWYFKIACHGLDLFILRDHMFLLTDLITDWSTGPPPDFYTFVPFHYALDVNFDDFNLFLNSNDANIVNDPSDTEDNNFLILRGQTLSAELGIPIDQYRPTQNGITFDVLGHNMSLDMSNSPKITLHSLLRTKRVATLKKLTLNGSHTYFVEQSPGLTDILQMDICGTDLELKAFGFLVRHFINVKENYFGEFLHFKTLEEYQDQGGDAANAEANMLGRHTFRPANDLDVILCIVTEHPIIILPANLYSAETYVKAELPTASVDLRVTNYYLDLSTDISPITISWFGPDEAGHFEMSAPGILIDRTNVSGHRLFGLPPTEPAYVSNWDIEIGNISGDCSLELVQQLAKAGRALAFSLDDHENALPLAQTAPIPDITFVRVNTGTVCLWFNDGKAAIRLFCDPVEVSQNDYARKLFSSRLVVSVPNITLTCADAVSTSRHRMREAERPAACIAFLQTSVELTLVTRKAHFQAEYEKQQNHVRHQDARSGRAHFLLDDRLQEGSESEDDDGQNDPPPMPLPHLSLPLGKLMRKRRSIKGVRAPDLSPNHPVLPQKVSGKSTSTGTDSEEGHPVQQDKTGAIPEFGQTSNPLSLWSPFAVPEAHFTQLHVDLDKVPNFTASAENVDAVSDVDNESLNAEGISLDQNDNLAHTTIMMRLEPGIRIYVEPRVHEDIFNIVASLLPKLPVDIIDTFQMDIMEKVSQIQGLKKSLGGIMEFNVIVPSVNARLFNEDKGDVSTPKSHLAQDQFDLNLSYLNLTIRSRNYPTEHGTESALLLHLTLESALVKLSNMLPGAKPRESAIRLGFDDVLVWLVLAKSKSIHVSFKDLLAAVSGQQSTYLASVFARYAALGTSIQNRADHVTDAANARLRYLTDFLTKNPSVSADPAYLSRMNYILRAYPDHFRNQDSWKIVARFRNIFEHLADEQRVELEAVTKNGCEGLVDNSSILATWAEWCSWDIPNIEKTQVFKTLLGETNTQRPTEELQPIELTLRGETVRFSIETSKKSSEVSIGGLAVGLSLVPPSPPSGLMLVDENVRTKITVQAHTAATVLRLNWDLLEEADQFIDIYFQKVAPALDILPDPTHGVPPQDSDENPLRQDFHVVYSTDQGSIEVESVNLKHVSSTENLRMSVIGTSRASHSYGQCFSALLTTKHAFTELHGRTNRIWRTDLRAPSIYADYRQKFDGSSVSVNIGGSYTLLDITIEQEMLGLLEVVDSIFVDEVLYIRRLQERVAREQLKLPKKHDSPGPDRALHLNVAFLAGKFSINVALLKALRLSISGETADVRVKPGLGPNKAFDVELHLGAMEHALVRTEDGATGQKAVLHTPPAVGTLQLKIDSKVDIDFSGTIQEVMLEASAVQSVLTIINQPEVQGVLEAIRDQISDLQHRIAEVLKEDKQVVAETATEKSKDVLYDISVSLGGLKISANAPAVTAGKARAELSLGIGSVQASISNKGLQDSKAIPNIHAQVQDIGATLVLIKHGKRSPCGHVTLGLTIDCSLQDNSAGLLTREIKARSEALDVNVFAETGATVVDIVTHVQQKILDLDLSREVEYLRRLRHSREKRHQIAPPPKVISPHVEGSALQTDSVLTNFSLDLRRIRLAWVVTEPTPTNSGSDLHNLELTFTRISLSIEKQNEARLSFQNLQLQLTPTKLEPFDRSENSALLPEVVFTVKYDTNKQGVKIAFQAAGKAVELRLDSGFVLPVSILQKSISLAVDKYRDASLNWHTEAIANNNKRASPFGDKRLVSLQADASFGGAIIYIQGEAPAVPHASLRPPPSDPSHIKRGDRRTNLKDKEDIIATSLRAPGIAFKVEFTDDAPDQREPTLNGEIRVDASTNTVYPEMVPIVLQISDNVKDVMRKAERTRKSSAPPRVVQKPTQKPAQHVLEDDSLLATDPSAIFGKTKLNIGLRICRQEFGLSCQPIARVNAKAQIEDIYVTMNTINSSRFGHFYSLSTTITKIGASVQHVYSRESTFNFDMESIVMSLMNSKHLTGGRSGISAVLRIAPTRTALNARQIQDLLLFREIWFPEELRDTNYTSTDPPAQEQEDMLVKRYHQVSSAAGFPWNATVAIADLVVDLELGQSIGKSTFNIKNLWASSTKLSTGKQDLCLGIDEVSIKSAGRMSGFIELGDVTVRTSIEWPDSRLRKAPLIQAAMGFGKLRAKSAFDYQPFGFADIEAFHFLMYNVREKDDAPDRLVAILDGDKVFVFCTSTSPAQAVGLIQAFDRLIQEKQGAYQQSLRDLEKQLQRRSVSQPHQEPAPSPAIQDRNEDKAKFPITLHTDVMVQLRAISLGAFPNTFFDNQILKLEASEMQARFAVGLEDGQIHSDLGMTLGQLQVALASVKRVSVPKTLGDISIDEVIHNASTAKGGIILRVPKVVASMQTWQSPENNHIDFIFKSSFEGKVDVGWNYSRISFIRGMWNTHSRTLASRLGKPLLESHVKITAAAGGSQKDADAEASADAAEKEEKITAVVNVPQSRFEYNALEPPIVETPQLRDLGEATPSLEWIGLHREKLPNVVHQILIVTLLEVAKEVEDAYDRILGSS